MPNAQLHLRAVLHKGIDSDWDTTPGVQVLGLTTPPLAGRSSRARHPSDIDPECRSPSLRPVGLLRSVARHLQHPTYARICSLPGIDASIVTLFAQALSRSGDGW